MCAKYIWKHRKISKDWREFVSENAIKNSNKKKHRQNFNNSKQSGNKITDFHSIFPAKSPVFTHLAATLNGLSTIRAYNAEKILRMEFDNHQDTHSACWYMFLATSSAFGLILDIMCLIFTFCIIFYYMIFDTGVSGEKVGLAVTQAMTLTGMLQWGMIINRRIQLLWNSSN